MKPFEAFYASALQQPVLLWCAAAIGLAVVATRRSLAPTTRVFCVAWSVVPFLDAWLTAERVLGLPPMSPGLATAVATAFVIVGDLRAFLFFEGATADGEILLDGRKIARAIAWSFIVPVTTALATATLPEAPWKGRATFLVYEASFEALVTARYVLGRRATNPWTRGVVRYVLAYYGLWVAADVVLLATGADAGFLLRVLPNVLYYGGLLAVVSLRAPARLPEPTPILREIGTGGAMK
jgi:hypothetical protein